MSSTASETVTATAATIVPKSSSVLLKNLIPSDPPKEVFRKDYKPPEYFAKHVDLSFQLAYESAEVLSKVQYYRNVKTAASADLHLHGSTFFDLVSVSLQKCTGGKDAASSPVQLLHSGDDYQQFTNGDVRISGKLLPVEANEVFILHIVTKFNPTANTELMGLYKAGPMLCSQCEAEGFRRITPFLDRPDVLSTYRVRLESERGSFPVMLSNGSPIESGEGSTPGRHYIVYNDPHPKPSYLFAVVAGDLAQMKDTFVRANGEPADIMLFSEPKDKSKLKWALECVKKAMKWDEVKFGRIYDLPVFYVVAVSHFNMGAMENKGLNIFNSQALLADRESATDADFSRVLGIVGHEYFHNWTGNRVTCRDWFQLTLKEGLTVFRDEEFSSDEDSRACERISVVGSLRAFQFQEDSGPMAHSIRPESYQQIDNFYTPTVYTKGSQVIRMYQTILGREGFRKGMDLYFERHDGQAVSCDDFLAAMSDANGVSLDLFSKWYSQIGTPNVRVVNRKWDQSKKQLRLTLEQSNGEYTPLHIPVATGVLSKKGKELVPTQILHLKEKSQEFVIDNVDEEPVPSILRDFSAPVKFHSSLTEEETSVLMAYDTDSFNRYEAGQRLMTDVILGAVKKLAGKDATSETLRKEIQNSAQIDYIIRGVTNFINEAQKSVDSNDSADLQFLSMVLAPPPDLTLLNEVSENADPIALSTCRKALLQVVAENLKDPIRKLYNSITPLISEYQMNQRAVGLRAMRNACLSYLRLASEEDLTGTRSLIKQHYDGANCLNDRLCALVAACELADCEEKTAILDDFLQRAGDDALVQQKWVFAQAGSSIPSCLDRCKVLYQDSRFDFSNPNFFRSLVGRFSRNVAQFHRADGAGYEWFTDAIIKVDGINGRTAAITAKALINYNNLDENRQALMRRCLQRILEQPKCSDCLKEVVVKGLAKTV